MGFSASWKHKGGFAVELGDPVNWKLLYGPKEWIVIKNWYGKWAYHAGVFGSDESIPQLDIIVYEFPVNWEPAWIL